MLVARDDADRLDLSLQSLRGFCDEIVVVDLGSTDDTVAVAEGHGAVVARDTWDGDLSRARNRAWNLTTGDWVLQIDPDETVQVAPGADPHVDDIDAVEVLAVRCAPRPGWTSVRQARIWRNRPELRFRGAVCERVLVAGAAGDAEPPAAGRPFDAVTIHRSGGATAAQARRALEEPVLLAELGRDPDRPLVSARLAQLHADAGDLERALDALRRAVAHARSSVRDDADDEVVLVALAHHLLTTGVVDDELDRIVQEARDRFPPSPVVELAAARLAFATGRPRDALAPLDWLLAMSDEEIATSGASCDERVFGEWAWSLLGFCRFALHDDEAAADAFGHAEQLAPHDASYAVRRRLAEARASTRAS
jgi:hypothetical protein